jgi:hypothetical protein
MTTFYCLRFETPPTCRARSPYLYPPGTGWPGYTPRYSTPPPHGLFLFLLTFLHRISIVRDCCTVPRTLVSSVDTRRLRSVSIRSRMSSCRQSDLLYTEVWCTCATLVLGTLSADLEMGRLRVTQALGVRNPEHSSHASGKLVERRTSVTELPGQRIFCPKMLLNGWRFSNQS